MRPLRTLFLLTALLPLVAGATHNRAGEIIYCHVNGYTYYVEIITHTKTSAPADRPDLLINWGDGTSSTLARTSIVPIPGSDAQRNIYPGTHTYNGPGVFELSFEDPNRNEGVLNVPSSVNQIFCVKTELVISPLGGNNCSVRFLNPPLQNACFQKRWEHNPVAFDPNGDSLSFELIPCGGANCLPIPGYLYPDQYMPGPANNFSIDPVTGTLVWDVPPAQGEYNIAIRVKEWRRVNGVMVLMGWVVRDMQITVLPCSNNAPVVQQLPDTCVVAGTLLNMTVQASDPDGNNVNLTALGEPFVLLTGPATFVSPSPGPVVTGVFTWSTNCAHVRPAPYQVVFRAVDNDPQYPLQDYSTMFITIVAPAPQNPAAAPSGSNIVLNWDASACTNATGYRIYRRSGAYGFTPAHCETDVPAYTGYQFIGSTTGWNNTTYTDASGLTFGNEYCYMVVATFASGSRSIASVEFCATLNRQVPLITHVSVGITDVTAGQDTVRWSNAYDMDTVQHPGPYRFRLFRGTGYTTATTLVYTSTDHSFLAHPDTSFIDNGLNTVAGPHVYRVDYFGAGDVFIGSSSAASSLFVVPDPNDEQITLNLTHNTPWTNTLFEIFRWDGSSWNLIGTSTTPVYVDTGLVNGQEYCYYARSSGAYSLPEVAAPLVNYSQEVCATPVDLTPPCPPDLVIDNDCEIPLNTLTWNNPNLTCADDTYQYNIYFTDSLNGTLTLIATITGAENTVFEHTDGLSVAGCYAVTAIDTVGNESELSNVVCGDNCPVYELPNVFTPNGDRVNDFFVPFPYRGVLRIDLQVFNRWGQVVYRTDDPDIGWDGTLQNNGERVPDGVYYYTCLVYFKRLEGDELIRLKGHVQLLRGNGNGVN
ncbi:MAG: gliding motility-associated C-terminal domain-containing protein [Flavobacteriales bacterium]|nr:gliding motility-associated C-terminal domain-containing protein [Flavobacteriales bacterium]